MISVHDHHVRELTVRAADRTVRLITAYPDAAGPEFYEAVFDGVETYVFNGDALGTILFDIEEVEPLSAYRDHAVEMQATEAQHGGHTPWSVSEEAAGAFFIEHSTRAFEISSSIGFTGVVWAVTLHVRRVVGAHAR